MRKPDFNGLRQKLRSLKDNVRAMDGIKTAVILLLFASAAVLAASSGLFSLSSFGENHAASPTGTVDSNFASGNVKAAVAGPYVIAVTGDSGSRCGLMYDCEEVGRAYDGFSAYLGEALGSAGAPDKVSEAQWRQALDGAGVYFDFAFEQPVSLLTKSMGIDMSSTAREHSARRFCLVTEDDAVNLYYACVEDGAFYKCSTAISPTAFSSRLSDYTPNGAKFLFETEYDYPLVDEYFLVPEGQPQIHGVTAQNPLGTDVDAAPFMELFGMNSDLAKPYTETDGTVYVDGSSTLRIGSDGTVTYKNSGELPQINAAITSEQAVSQAARIAANTIGTIGGEGSTVLSNVSYDEATNAYTVRYAYQIDGLIVSMGSQYAMSVTMADGVVTEAEINFREYSYSGEEDSPMPAKQAMAVVQAKGGGTPLMCYTDYGGTVGAGWIIVK